jgi:hypothetical protein
VKTGTLGLCVAALLASPCAARASADFVIEAKGAGFSDATAVSPVGGNKARTLGAQRLAAVKYAANLWGKLLDSPVPIVVQVDFSDLGCKAGADITLAGARPAGIVYDDDPSEERLFEHAVPYALASRIAGFDVAPSDPDVMVSINTAVDQDCRALLGGWYYGFDGAADGQTDLVDVLLHELAHGLGFSSTVDDETGELAQFGDTFGEPKRALDVFSAHVLDARTGRLWSELSDRERLRSATTPRGAVWTGSNVRAAVEKYLKRGAPRLTFEPPLPGFSGMIGDGGSGAPLTARVPRRSRAASSPSSSASDPARCASRQRRCSVRAPWAWWWRSPRRWAAHHSRSRSRSARPWASPS